MIQSIESYFYTKSPSACHTTEDNAASFEAAVSLGARHTEDNAASLKAAVNLSACQAKASREKAVTTVLRENDQWKKDNAAPFAAIVSHSAHCTYAKPAPHGRGINRGRMGEVERKTNGHQGTWLNQGAII